MPASARFTVEHNDGTGFSLVLDEVSPPGSITLSGNTISFAGNVDTYQLVFDAGTGLQFDPLTTISGSNGISFIVGAPTFAVLVEITISPTAALQRSFTINTTVGPFDPSIVIDPPPPMDGVTR